MKKKKNVSFFTKQKTNISVELLSSFKITSTERAGISKTNPIKDLEIATFFLGLEANNSLVDNSSN